jgi:hypothetical protein
MSTYKITATFEVSVTQSGRSLPDARRHEREVGTVLKHAVNHLLLQDPNLLERLWAAAGGGDNFDALMAFDVVDVTES